ncbi:MAG: hypothetical protein J6A94_03810 [Lachnospiraceae bacterium]|nr:hypothetical protein [Lachnospiraceae bacterium]
MQIIGYITPQVINTLGLEFCPNTPIYIGESNIEHIKNRHPYEYEKYFSEIENIINSPDYVGKNPKDSSLLFVKLYKIANEYLRVAIKVSASGKCFAKTLHLLSTCNAERYIEKGTLKKIEKRD